MRGSRAEQCFSSGLDGGDRWALGELGSLRVGQVVRSLRSTPWEEHGHTQLPTATARHRPKEQARWPWTGLLSTRSHPRSACRPVSSSPAPAVESLGSHSCQEAWGPGLLHPSCWTQRPPPMNAQPRGLTSVLPPAPSAATRHSGRGDIPQGLEGGCLWHGAIS